MSDSVNWKPGCATWMSNAIHLNMNQHSTVLPICAAHDNEEFLLDVGQVGANTGTCWP